MSILDMNFFSLIGLKKKPKGRWTKYYSKKEMNLDVPNISIYQFLKNKSLENNYKDNVALEYYGTKITYGQLFKEIDRTARALRNQGVRRGDVVTILSANIPEAIYSFYALNKIGAVANMIHPLSGENEIKEALQRYSTAMLIAMDITYEKFKNILDETDVYKTIIISAKDSMNSLLKIGYEITQGRKVVKPNKSNREFLYWKDFIKEGENYTKDKVAEFTKRDTPAVILHSGGTTGTPKGIVLSNGNFNAATIQTQTLLKTITTEDSVLAIMPIFHGFGLSVSIIDVLSFGAKVILIPTFKASEFDKLLTKYKPSILVGVPTLFEALMTNERMKNVNLSHVKLLISGGDTLNKARIKKLNEFLTDHGTNATLLQGYGMTESVAAVCLDRQFASRPGTIGIPFPSNYIKIVKPGTHIEADVDEDGELCICGPTVMLGYYNNEKETNEALHIHDDGNVWLHSGDIASMDKDGYITYKQRLKRMIVTSGYNVYPSQIEEVIERHEAVVDCSVIGVPHPYKIEVAKAYIALKQGYKDTPKLRQELLDLCKKNLAAYSVPKEFEFRKSLPKTMIGKVDFRKLQQENMEKRAEESYGK